MIWVLIFAVVVMIFIGCGCLFFYCNRKLDETVKRIDYIIAETNKKVDDCIETQKQDSRTTKNLINATNTLKREVDKMQQALTIFNNGFDGVQSTM